jgi:hypothetical protein
MGYGHREGVVSIRRESEKNCSRILRVAKSARYLASRTLANALEAARASPRGEIASHVAWICYNPLRLATPRFPENHKTDNRAHSPNTAPQTGTTMLIKSLTAAGKFAQTILALRAGPLSFISARSKKRATIRISPAMITNPTKTVPQPGPGKGANKRLVTTTTIPPTITRTFRRAELPWPLRWLRRYRARNR